MLKIALPGVTLKLRAPPVLVVEKGELAAVVLEPELLPDPPELEPPDVEPLPEEPDGLDPPLEPKPIEVPQA